MVEPWLLIETSDRGGRLGLALNGVVVERIDLDPARRHNRDLAPAIGKMFRSANLVPRQLHSIAVSHGPGSFTGLRVGLMTTKALAYATGCRLIVVPTFHAIAWQTSAEARFVEVIADGLQGLVYCQRFRRETDGWLPEDELRLEMASNRLEQIPSDAWISGPAVEQFDSLIPEGVTRVARENRRPTVDSLFAVGTRIVPLSRDQVMNVEPLYLRPSSAEEKANRLAAG